MAGISRLLAPILSAWRGKIKGLCCIFAQARGIDDSGAGRKGFIWLKCPLRRRKTAWQPYRCRMAHFTEEPDVLRCRVENLTKNSKNSPKGVGLSMMRYTVGAEA